MTREKVGMRRGKGENLKLIECPRDAWQGVADFIPTEIKAAYLKESVAAGFRHIDAVSFVSREDPVVSELKTGVLQT
jgi:hypothetical protein